MILHTQKVAEALDSVLRSEDCDRLFILADETTARLCRPLLEACAPVRDAVPIVIGPTDVHKNIESLVSVWAALGAGGGTRHSLLINLGGGMVTDLGGFAAATFKRGIRYVNIPTTLLSMVDAAVGGKTGINFGGLKNEIGAFSDSVAVIVDTHFLQTLDAENIRSGYAEMLKHALLKDERMWAEHLAFDLEACDLLSLGTLVKQSIDVKQAVVTEDPHEKGLRKALNLGHTVGHAFESLAMKRGMPLLHGYAVAFGLVCELYLSARMAGFPADKLRQTVAFIRRYYGSFGITCDDYKALHSFMLHDKKNVGSTINFTLLSDVGGVKLDCHATRPQIDEMFDFFREG